jgi:putative RecB family exonuclease
MPAARKASAGKRGQGRKPTLSPTRITTYLECAVKYKYIYADKIGRYFTRARAGYSFGSTLHHVLQEFHEQGAAHSAEEMVEELEQKWIGAGYETQAEEDQHREVGQQIVQAYHLAHQERLEAQVETIATEKTLTWDTGPFKLTGRVDRIDRHPDGRLEIIDYKSGRWDITPEEVAGSLAMNCYQLIARHLNPDTPVFGTIYCLRSGLSASFELAGEALAQFEQDILELGREILERDYSLLTPVPVEACPDCDFLALCSRFWREQRREESLDTPHYEDE